MPQRKCCVSSCSSSLIDGVVLHTFPNPSNDCERFQTWVSKAGLFGEDDDYIFRNRRICHSHFEEIYHYPKNRLNRLAIPTLHLSGVTGDAIAESEPMVVREPQTSTWLTASTVTESILGDATSSRPVPMIMDDLQPSTSVKCNIGIGRTLQFKSLSKTETELYNAIAKTQAQLKRCEKTKAGLKDKLKLAKKLSRSKAYEAVTKDLSPAAQSFFAMQTRQASKQPRGRRFTLDEKILALSLYKPSPKAYRILSQICVLPQKSTLNKLITKISLSPGPNDIIFDHLKKRVNKMPSSHKYCTLIFDEMAISANLSYDKHNDTIKGLCDDGVERTKCFADHVLVFMVRGIFKKYKQPVAYSFCAGTTKTGNLKNQIKDIIKKVLATGLKVVSTTCDQGPTNMAAINSLINDTKAQYLREGKDFRGGFFEIENIDIYPIYDPPHMMKGIRNNLITKNLEFTIDGKTRRAKWEHLVAFYKKSPTYHGARMVTKLTARHVIPSLIPKMKVNYCTQVFSHTVSVALGLTAGRRRVPREAVDTAELFRFFDRLFDSVNGSYSTPRRGKIYRSAVTRKSPHWKLWDYSLPVLKSMRYICGNETRKLVPSLSSWIKTIEAFQQIIKKLQSIGLDSLLLRNFNQDPLENFFGAIRAHGHANIMPSAQAFEASYKILLINNMVSPNSVGANCEIDNTFCLQNLKYFLTQKVIRPLPKNIEINFDHLNIELPNIEHLIKSQAPEDLEKCAAAAYCCGWLISLIYKSVIKKCEFCKNDLEGDSEEAFSKFITLKKHTDKCILHYPNKQLLECFIHIEEISINILQNTCQSPTIANYIELVTSTLISLNFLKCENHHLLLSKFIIKKSIQFCIRDWCKEVNNILIGKNTVFDERDPMKILAHKHFVKNKTKKRVLNV